MRDLRELSTLDGPMGIELDPRLKGKQYTPKEAEMEAVRATKAELADERAQGARKQREGSDDDDVAMTDVSPPMDIPPSQNRPTGSGSTTPAKRRAGPPGSIPNFQSAMTPREPPPFFNSPITSPPHQRSPFSSPPSRAPNSLRLPTPSFPPGVSSPASPWHALAASSGAPTPAIDGPGRSSPHLGYPFEQLNIGGSWSGANLWGDQGRRMSIEPVTEEPSNSSSTPASTIPPDTLARYRMMAGKASANGRRSSRDEGSTMADSPSGSLSSSPTSRAPLPAVLAKRRGSVPKNILEGILSPPPPVGTKAPSPLGSSTSIPAPTQELQPISTSAISQLINKTSTLILDVRAPSAYQSSHLPSSHSIPVPSTLLRRPAFTLQKLGQMLTVQGAEAVSHWKDKHDIVLVDADTSTLPSSGLLEGLAAKFFKEGYTNNVWFAKGGHAALEQSKIPLVSDEDQNSDGASTSGSRGHNMMVGRLDKLAFQQDSTGSNLQHKSTQQTTQTPAAAPRGNPFASFPDPSRANRPVFPNVQSVASSATNQPADSTFQRNGSGQVGQKMQPANPFFDNIRQNLELSHGGGHERIALGLDEETLARTNDLPLWLSELSNMPQHESAEQLAEEFFRVELGEQKRLQAVMDWHSKSSGTMVAHEFVEQKEADNRAKAKLEAWKDGNGEQADYFPYSISAGVERGTKNRYKNIWPYDYSRVRLNTPPEDEGDYINASFVQPRGTSRRYIATQGPMDSTFRDFWTLVWEQRVSVIVMLTKQFEGGLVKCGNYWDQENYGPLRVQLVSQTGGEDRKPDSSTTGFDFGMSFKSPGTGDAPPAQNIRRTLTLSRSDKPEEPARKIVQIQCTAWPDFDVPDTPDILVDLMRDVDEASNEIANSDSEDHSGRPPVLVHCSAGIGRTGTFIVVDAVVDALRQERRRTQSAQSSSSTGADSPRSQPLHSMSLPHLKPSTAVHDLMIRQNGSSSQSSFFAPQQVSAPSGAESSRSVSFLEPPESNNGMPALSSSPDPIRPESAGPPSTASSQTTPTALSNTNKATPTARNIADAMDLDPVEATEDSRRKSMFDDLFTKHRGGSSVASVDSEPFEGKRRPSLATTSGRGSAESSERVDSSTRPVDATYMNVDMPNPVTLSSDRHRTPSPVEACEGLSPVALVLEGMRKQRMSLVQSLRQYLYCHRAIIQSYLNIVDEDRREGRARSRSTSSEPAYDRRHIRHTSSSTDDEGPPKRRASPTELMPEAGTLRGRISSGATGLAKRASFKKMRPANMEGITPAEEGSAIVGVQSPRRSKLNKETSA